MKRQKRRYQGKREREKMINSHFRKESEEREKEKTGQDIPRVKIEKESKQKGQHRIEPL
jgi:hypothetical protein